MIFAVAKIELELSQCVQLQPGDVITTGTPQGVVLRIKPKCYLNAGDKRVLGIDGLGESHQTVAVWTLALSSPTSH